MLSCVHSFLNACGGRTQHLTPSAFAPAAQQMGPVGEQESKPSIGAPPANSVVDPGVIPSRQQITPAGLQSVFESRVFGVAFGENGESIYAAVLGQKGTLVYQIDLKSNQMMGVSTTETSSGMQGLTYDPATHMALLSGLAGSGKGRESSGQLVALSGKGTVVIAKGLGSNQIGGVAMGGTRNSRGHRLAAVALTFDDEAAIIDVDTKEVIARVKTGDCAIRCRWSTLIVPSPR